jgi:predicted porin
MQKKLIALAVAGLASSAAFAQSNVQIFGTLRPSYDFVSAKDSAGNKSSLSTMNSNSSTIGFQGEEALGNGLKAIFKMEYNIDIANENTSIGGDGAFSGKGTQDMYVGFAGDSWGTVKFGALNNKEKDYFGSYDPFAFSIGDYNNIFTQGVNSRNSQAVSYDSPVWSGFKFGASYALEGGKDSKNWGGGKNDSSILSLAADYTYGGLKLTAGWSQGNNVEAGVDGGDFKSQRYGAAYTFASSKTKLFGVYGIDKDFKNQGAGGSYNTWMVGAVQPITSNIDLMADYIKASDDDTTDTGTKNYNLGAKYSFSKRTNVQALYSYIKNDTNASRGFDSGYNLSASNADGDPILLGGKASAFSLRLQHNF